MHSLPVLTRRLAGALVLAFAFALPASTFAQTPPLIRVGAGPDDPSIPLLYAVQSGMYAKAGLNVEIVRLSGAAAVAAALAGGSLELGKGAPMTIVPAIAKGLPFTIIGSSGFYTLGTPQVGLVVLKDSPIKTAKDLNGKTLGVNGLKNIAEYAPSMWIDKNGGDSSTVKFVEIRPAAAPAALAAHRIDACFVAEPQITEAKATSRVFAKPYDVLGDGFMIAGYFTMRPWAQAHPELVHKFQDAMRETAAWANANPDKSADILAKYTKLDPALVRASYRAKFGESLSAAAIQPTIDLAAHYKLLEAFPAADLIYTK
jgi:NitT/TauT family transport system substrate-binding protein